MRPLQAKIIKALGVQQQLILKPRFGGVLIF